MLGTCKSVISLVIMSTLSEKRCRAFIALTGMNDMLLEERKYPSTESLLLFHEENSPTASTKAKYATITR